MDSGCYKFSLVFDSNWIVDFAATRGVWPRLMMFTYAARFVAKDFTPLDFILIKC